MPDTARLRDLLGEATPGPWAWATDDGAPVYVQLYATDEAVDEYDADVLSSDARGVLVSEANAALIAKAVNALPALLDVVDLARRYREMWPHDTTGEQLGHVRRELFDALDELAAEAPRGE